MQDFQNISYIAGEKLETSAGFQSSNPATDEQLPWSFAENSIKDVDSAATAASEAFKIYSKLSDNKRAEFLDAIGTELESSREAIVERAMQETALPSVRLNGELGRTIGQLKLFADLLRDGNWVRAVIDTALPDREPLPRPDIRLMNVPLGPVGVFGASNFPLAFSAAGGDTASALAAGCPVIVKAHSAHPGTSLLVAEAIFKAVKKTDMPNGVFSILFGTSHSVGSELVKHPKITAVGFTGSVGGGRALFDLATQRPSPIPFYGELGSTNPVFLLPNALEKNEGIATQFVASLSMGCGQFCTNPGLLIAKKGDALTKLLSDISAEISQQAPQAMLTAGIAKSYRAGTERIAGSEGVELVAQGSEATLNQAQPALYKVSAAEWLENESLEEEVFGPMGLLVECDTEEEMLKIAERIHGHLTGSVHYDESDNELASKLIAELQNKVGRILFNGWPTGVEVGHSMTHGGPYPSSTDSRSTSVGSRAIERWIRPVSYQNTPDNLLPLALQNGNPLKIWRKLNGELTKDSV